MKKYQIQAGNKTKDQMILSPKKEKERLSMVVFLSSESAPQSKVKKQY